jgi:mannose-1-phosphate guanylyltransferase
MKAVLLAAGLGTRLKPITDSIPKCMVPINGKPLLDYWLELLSKNPDIDEIFINVSYLKAQVTEHLANTWGHLTQLTIWNETSLLGTAGTLVTNYECLSGDHVLVIHADNLSKFPLEQFIQAHYNRPKDCLATMMLFNTDTPSSCGIVELDEQNRLLKMHEKVATPPGRLANGAVYIFTPEMLNWIHKNQLNDISAEVIPAYEGSIFTWENNIYHRDIGTPESYQLAQQEFTKIDSGPV